MQTKNGAIYHTALSKKGGNSYSFKCDRCENGGNVAFQHDLTIGVHEDFLKADCIYSEPAWRAGYEKFVEKSGVQGASDYNTYLDNVYAVIRAVGKPAYIFMGKAMIKRLKPDFTFPIKHTEHGFDAVIGVYNVDKDSLECQSKTTHELIDAIAKKYQKILNFSCGFGNIIPYVLKNGKNFIVSDICADCIGYIAEKYMEVKA